MLKNIKDKREELNKKRCKERFHSRERRMNKGKSTFNPFLRIVLMYAVVVFFGGLILQWRPLLQDGQSVSFLDGLFTSISSFATTGLTVLDITQVYNYYGWVVLIIFFNIGGMGIMTLNTILFMMIGRKVGVKGRELAKVDQNTLDTKGMVSILITIVKMFLVIELVGTILIFLRISYIDGNFIDRFMNSWFMAASALTGSGFYDTVPYAHDYLVLLVLIFLMIFSFIGYPVLIDLKNYFLHKKKKSQKKYQFSLFTKIVVKVNIITVVMFAVLFILLEHNNAMAGYSIFDQIYYSFYLSISTKSVGLNVFSDINQFKDITLVFSMIFMIIGGSPSSACGGIRVSTIYVIYVYMRSQFKGYSMAVANGFYIGKRNILKAYNVTVLFILISFIGFCLILAFDKVDNSFALFYDVISAITTTGFSTGAINTLSNVGEFILILLMLIGRVGIVNIINSFHKKEKSIQRINYVEKEVII